MNNHLQRALALILLIVLLRHAPIPVAQAAPGDLDTSFDGDGKSILSFGTGRGIGYGSAIQADGKIVVVGTSFGDPDHRVFGIIRYNADGTLDSSFNGTGKVETDFAGTDIDEAYAVAIQADGKIVVAGSILALATNQWDFALARYDADGSLDTTFDGDGKATIRFANALTNQALGLAMQPDGKIIVVGLTASSGINTDFAIARYNSDGSLDSSFDSDGKVTTNIFFSSNSAAAVALQSDGKIVVVGDAQELIGGNFMEVVAVARYNPNGSLDTTFDEPLGNHDGIVTVLAGSFGYATSVALQPTGEIVVGGIYSNNAGNNYYIVRLLSNGFLDTTTHTKIGTGNDYCKSVKIQSDGKIVASGYSEFPAPNFSAARYNTDLTLDTTFSGDGKVRTEFAPGSVDKGSSMVLQTDGKIVISGASDSSNNYLGYGTLRYNSNGTLDNMFSSDGKVVTSTGYGPSEIRASAIQADGKLLVAGSAEVSFAVRGFFLARYNLDGTLDNSFSSDGFTTTVVNGYSTGYAMAVQADGKIIVAGSCANALCLARYQTNGNLDTTFSPFGSPPGTLYIPPGNFRLSTKSVAIQADGKILVGGSRRLQSNSSFNRSLIYRLNSDGSFDNDFGSFGEASVSTGSLNQEFRSLKIQADGGIVAVTDGVEDTNEDFGVLRFTSGGLLDSTFDGDGKVFTDFGADDSVNSVDILPDGKIIVCGKARVGSKTVFAIARYTAAGMLDMSFGLAGKLTTSIGVSNDVANSLKVQANGKLIVGGYSSNPEADFTIVRYNSDGSLDNSGGNSGWGNGGIVVTDIGGSDKINTLAIQADGKIVVAGASSGNIAVARYLSDAAAPVSISGHLTYANGTTAARNVTMTLTGPPGFTQRTTDTDSSGNYSFSNLPAGGNYTVTPSKTGDVNGITAFDASLAARFAAQLISLTANQQVAGDASNNGSVSAFDASLIARTAVNIPNTGIAGTWKFSPTSLSVNNLNANQTNQNLTAILVGDVSGNWTPAGPAPLGPLSTAATITVSLPNKQDPPGGPSTIPISVGDMTGQGVFAYSFDLSFNQAVLQPQATPFDSNGTLSGGLSVTSNSSTPGHLLINVFSSSNEISGQGILLNLKFNVVGAPASTTPLNWASFEFNEGDPGDTNINGSFTAAAPTAAPARISGRIVSDEGQPVSGATVTVLGGSRTIRVITNRDGFYKAENLETGGFYTLTPTKANYVFAPGNRAFSLLADQTQAVFTGLAIGPDANPLESPEFFVRQQYLDFLGREPDQGGLDYWSGQLRACGADPECLNTRRMEVSAAFFMAPEFQESGLFIYGLYQGALGRRPQFAEYAVDRTKVVGGPTLETKKAAFATSFVERAKFSEQYPLTMTAEVFVDALLRTAQQTSGLDLSGESASLINLYNRGANASESRSLVVRSVVEGSRFKQTQYNSAFVLMEYFGYLGRNADREGYEFWLNILNNSGTSHDRNNYRGMVCSFITSSEYQQRFSPVVTRNNTECGP